jgi:hypothetical protein
MARPVSGEGQAFASMHQDGESLVLKMDEAQR